MFDFARSAISMIPMLAAVGVFGIALGMAQAFFSQYFQKHGGTHIRIVVLWTYSKLKAQWLKRFRPLAVKNGEADTEELRKKFDRFYRTKNIYFALILMLLAIPAFATDRCIRDGGNSASTTCTEWGTTACDDFPSNSVFSRSDTIYYAGGNYSYLVLNKPISGSNVITVKRATVADHGTCNGWSDSYATRPVIAGVEFQTNHWKLTGGSRNESNWDDGPSYGLRVTDTIWSSVNNPGSGSPCADDITIEYVDQGGPDVGNVYDAANPGGLQLLGESGVDVCDGWHVDHDRFHNTTLAEAFTGASNGTFEYNYTVYTWGKECLRGGRNQADNNNIIRFNVFKDCVQTIPGDATSTPTAPIAIWGTVNAGDLDGIEIYGNLLYITVNEEMTAGCIVVGGDGGDWQGVSANNFKIYNNTCAGFKHGSSSQYGILGNGNGSGGTGNEAKNNLFYDVVGTFTVAIGSGGTASNNTVAGSDPFVNYSGGNFHLSANTAAGATLSSPYNVDLDGVTRGGSAAWSLGVFQYVSGTVTYRGRPLAFFFSILIIVFISSTLNSRTSQNRILIDRREHVIIHWQ